MTYEISKNKKEQERIKCLVCNMTSYHPEDIKNRYCGNCHEFHPILNLKKKNSKINDPYLQHDFCKERSEDSALFYELQRQIAAKEGEIYQDFINWLKD